MDPQNKGLQEFLSQAIQKERLAYRRSIYVTAIPVVVGLGLFLFFTYRVVRLRQESVVLDKTIEEKTKELKELQVSLETTRDQSADNALKANKSEQALEKIASGTSDPKKQAAEALRALVKPTPITRSLPAPSPVPTQPPVSGFVGTTYHGRDKSLITIEVTARLTRLAVTYDFDGKVGELKDNAAVFHFTLDKSKHDPSRLFMFFDFYSEKDGAYDVKVTASDGSVFNMTVPQGDKPTRTRVLYFDVL